MDPERDLPLIGALVGLFLVAMFLAAAETSLIRISRVRAQTLVEEGRRGARRLMRLVDDLPRVLNTVLLTVLLVQIGAATITGLLADRWFGGIGVTVASMVLTVLMFVYTEAIPKTFAVRNADRVAPLVAPVIGLLAFLLRPVVTVLVWLADLQAPGKGVASSAVVTEGELRRLAEEAAEAGELRSTERELIEKVFRFDELVAEEVMVPRPDIVAVAADSPVEEAVRRALQAGHRRLPVYRGDLDEIVGVVYLRELVRAEEGEGTVGDLARPPLVVPETKRVVELLREMQQAGTHLAVVVDEYGGTAGLVTIEDVVEELLGEVADEGEGMDRAAVQLGQGHWMVDGRMLEEDLAELLAVELPEGDWHTAAGLVMALAGKVPGVGEEVEAAGHRFRVTAAGPRRVRRIEVERVEPQETPSRDRNREV